MRGNKIEDLEEGEKYDPQILLLAYSRKLTELMEKLIDLDEKLVDLTVPEGRKEEFNPTVTDEPRKIVAPYKPFRSFDIFNDGPDPVYFNINSEKVIEADMAPVNNGESVDVDMGASVIHVIYLQCDHGNEADVRIHAIW